MGSLLLSGRRAIVALPADARQWMPEEAEMSFF